MKRIAIAVCVVVLVSAVAAWAQTQAQPKSESVEHTEQELITLENGWNDAMVKHNWAFLDQIIADDYTGTDSDGIMSTKAQEIANLKSGDSVVKYAVADDFMVRVYGDVAVVTFRHTSKGEEKGKDTSGQFRITDTWVKSAGHWQCAAGHSSRIAQK